MRVLVAPDLIELADLDGGARPRLDALDVAAHLADGWSAARPADMIAAHPLSDGARGLLDVVRARRASVEEVVVARDARGAPQPVTWLRAGATAYLDVSELLGDPFAPDAAEVARHGTSAGAGDLVLAAVRAGASRVVLGVGETAVHDGGVGALRALAGASGEQPLAETVRAARTLLAAVEVVVAAAAELPLVGLSGAGAATAARPGIDRALAQSLERRIAAAVAEIEAVGPPSVSLLADHGRRPRPARAPMSGAGGGLALALSATGARILPGAEVTAVETDLTAAVDQADLVLSACSRLDGAAIDAGVPAAVGRRAISALVPVVALAPEVLVSRRELSGTGIEAVYPVATDPVEAGEHAESLARQLADRAARVARTWSR